MLQIRFLGQFDVRADGKRLLISTRAAQSLFGYLVLTAGTPHRREKLAGLLWQEVSDENARRSLRQELWRLRKVLNSQSPADNASPRANEYLLADELTVAFDAAAPYWFDVAQLEQNPSNDELLNDLTRQVGLYKGELLPGFYEDWVLLERERVEQLFERKMQQLVELLVQQERWTAALEWGERWIAQGHTPEPAYRAMMLSYAALGNPSQVTLNYERCVHALQNELGVEPSEETRVLYEHLLKGAQLHYSPAQPTATVTFLFTDIEGSTRLLEKLREQYARVLHEHHEILRAAVQKWNGREIDTQGDAFFVTFTRASDAIACAVEAQRALNAHDWIGSETVRVRMGLHTGEPLMATTGYIGMDVHRAARIGDAGHGGQVLLSHTTRALAGAELPNGVTVRALGEHRLKDLKFPTDIYQLVIEGLPNDFPPLRTGFGAMDLPAPGEPPFKGMEFFDEADAAIFFGREAITAKLLNALNEKRFLAVVVGASGSGKSSIVRAGLVPALKKTTDDGQQATDSRGQTTDREWRVFVMTPTAHPLEALAVTLTRNSESVTATATLLDDLTRDPRSLQLFLRRQTADHRQQTAPFAHPSSLISHPLLVVDQFEELFTLCRDDFEREQFIDNLLDAVNVGGDGATRSQLLTLVLTLRADFYSHLAQYPELRDAVAEHQEYIGPMNVEELRRAIEEPARQANWEFEPGLVDLILRDVGDEPGALPLLSHALLETWKRRNGHTMTLKGYAESGGVRGAIAQTAESTYQQLTMEHQIIARDIFLRLTELGDGTEDTRRRAEIRELEIGDATRAQVREVLTLLADARLITTSENSAEVAHEALIREWPRLREWLNKDREGLQLQRHLTEAAHEWELMERDTSVLYRGARLAQAREWADANARALNEQERAFLEASEEQEQRETREREDQRERELLTAQKLAEEQERRATESNFAAKKLRRRAVFLASALVLTLVLAAVAFVLMGIAQNQSDIAKKSSTQTQSLALTSAAQLAADRDNPELGLAYALAANKLNPPVVEAQLPLSDLAYASGFQHRFTGHSASVVAIAYSPDGKTALSGGFADDNTLILWDVVNGKMIRRFEGHTDGVSNVVFSPDGKTALSASYDASMILWDVVTGKQIRQFKGDMNVMFIGMLSADGKTALSGSADESLGLWDVESGKLIHHFKNIKGLFIATLSPDAKTALLGFSDGHLALMDMASGEILRRYEGHTDLVSWVAFSPDGARALSSSVDKTVILWDVATGNMLRRLRGHKDVVATVVFSPDGKTALSGGGAGTSFSNILDKSIIWWDLETGQILKQFDSKQENIIGMAFSPDGHNALTGSGDKTMVLWALQSSAEIHRLTGHKSAVNAVALSSDGKRGISGSADGDLILWDTATGDILRRIEGESIVNALAFSSDGRTIYVGTIDGAFTARDAESGEVVKKFVGHSGPANAVVLSADGKTALSGSSDNTMILWNTANGEILRTLQGHTNVVNAVALSPDGKRALSASYDHSAILWDVTTGQIIRRFPQTSVVNSVAFSPDGKTAVLGLADGGVVQIDLDTGTELRRFVGHEGAVKSVAFSPDGKSVLSGALDKIIFEWDVASGQAIRRFVGHNDTVNAVAFNPDGKTALSGSVDKTVRVWRIDSLNELIEWTQAHRIISEVPCDQRALYNLALCDANRATPSPTP